MVRDPERCASVDLGHDRRRNRPAAGGRVEELYFDRFARLIGRHERLLGTLLLVGLA